MMFRGTFRLVAAEVLLAGSVAGCSSATDPAAVGQKISLQTSSDTVFVRPLGSSGLYFSAPLTITNTSNATLFLNCFPSIDTFVDDQWVVFTTPLCLDPSRSQRLLPGEVTTLYADAADAPRVEQRVSLNPLGGRYRVKLRLFVEAAFPGGGIFESQNVQVVLSNEFTTAARCIVFPGPPPLGCI